MINDVVKLRLTHAGIALTALLFAPIGSAQEFIKGGEEKFVLSLGGVVNTFDTSLRLDGSTGQGSSVNLENNGLGHSDTSGVIGGTWRFAPKHRLDFRYFQSSRSGSKQTDREITIGDDVVAVGSNVNAEAKAKFLWLDYRYSFHKTDTVEWAGVLGFYGGKFDFNVSGTSVSSGTSKSFNHSASTGLPLPVIGVTADWYVNPRWRVSAGLEGMAAKIGDVNGNAVNFALASDYMLTRNFGLGASYLYTRVNADVTKSDFNGNFTWKTSGILLYATAKF